MSEENLFTAWRKRMGWTQKAASVALGINKDTARRLDHGTAVSTTVTLAMAALEEMSQGSDLWDLVDSQLSAGNALPDRRGRPRNHFAPYTQVGQNAWPRDVWRLADKAKA